MSKYIADASARDALEVAAMHASRADVPVPFVWNGAQWATQGGEWRDWPLIRREVGGWLRGLADALSGDGALTERRRRARRQLDAAREALEDAGVSEEEEERQTQIIGVAYKELEATRGAVTVQPALVRDMRVVASEIESASDARATQLLSLASQFDAFRASLSDPASWVRSLGTAPRGVHVRTAAVWEAFSAAEPVLARSLGMTTGKRALFAAMDKRFGARRKLAGYEGWRGVALPE
ncbi:hypothetical protein OYE22_24205 [Streptomyces sp. 71268]|uniref:hypothetical protein n=1 Tax=Streptomyces sp. 71268 TaxID=3002640 RepID=UPI0023F85E08|nr:hypothetical protein [Streptomyces sp. 71268]WEV27927.1 hypothetical protein OYE22_24205 [Streptomyces sp. 71268]